jgi:hypothetical protein
MSIPSELIGEKVVIHLKDRHGAKPIIEGIVLGFSSDWLKVNPTWSKARFVYIKISEIETITVL